MIIKLNSVTHTITIKTYGRGVQGIQGIQGVTGEGVVEGGTTGQVLVKASNDDFDTEWVDKYGIPPTLDNDFSYSISNYEINRAFDADSVNIDVLVNTLSTISKDLQDLKDKLVDSGIIKV